MKRTRFFTFGHFGGYRSLAVTAVGVRKQRS
jgi:hypothetical protein